jgi:hypothetical protein
MQDIQDLIEGLQKLVSKADDVQRANTQIDKRLYCEIAIARAYLDRRLNQIERLAERAA